MAKGCVQLRDQRESVLLRAGKRGGGGVQREIWELGFQLLMEVQLKIGEGRRGD